MTAGANRLVIDERRILEVLRSFEETTRLLFSGESKLAETYSGKWVGLHTGKVRATGDSLQEVLAALDAGGWPRQGAIVRFMEKNPTPLILQR